MVVSRVWAATAAQLPALTRHRANDLQGSSSDPRCSSGARADERTGFHARCQHCSVSSRRQRRCEDRRCHTDWFQGRLPSLRRFAVRSADQRVARARPALPRLEPRAKRMPVLRAFTELNMVSLRCPSGCGWRQASASLLRDSSSLKPRGSRWRLSLETCCSRLALLETCIASNPVTFAVTLETSHAALDPAISSINWALRFGTQTDLSRRIAGPSKVAALRTLVDQTNRVLQLNVRLL